ncbi:histidinol dehydrogenase [Actinobacillus equuli]|nr:histidinol dehydrogenase [Actinobacillus equuli]
MSVGTGEQYANPNLENLTEQQRKEALTRPAISSSLNIQQAVESIRENVLENGDKALFELSEKFDKVKLDSLVVSKAQLQAASDRLSDELNKRSKMPNQILRNFTPHKFRSRWTSKPKQACVAKW